MDRINAKLKELPKSPGVYHFLDDKGSVLYVGKAKNLKNRLRQYFLKELGRGPAIEQMVQLSSDIRYIETDSEIEAVILEAELIKKLRPKYNVRLKDDKSFLVIKITRKSQKSTLDSTQVALSAAEWAKVKSQNEGGLSGAGFAESNRAIEQSSNFPSVELVRFKGVDLSDKTADYFGPYPSGLLLKKSLNYLRKIFPFRDCSKTKFNTYRRKQRACIYKDLGVCSGPCLGEISPLEYEKNIRYLKDFLRNKKGKIVKNLEREMTLASKKKNYELAAEIRNKLQGLNHLKDVAIGLRDDVFNKDKIIFKRIECFDIANIGDQYAVGSMVVFIDGKAEKDEYRRFKVKSQKSKVKTDEGLPNNDLERLQQVLERRFKNDWAKPDLIVVDGGLLQLRVAREILQNSKLNIPVLSISKGPKRRRNDFHFGSSFLAQYFGGNESAKSVVTAARDEAHRFAISYYRKLHRKDMIDG